MTVVADFGDAVLRLRVTRFGARPVSDQGAGLTEPSPEDCRRRHTTPTGCAAGANIERATNLPRKDLPGDIHA